MHGVPGKLSWGSPGEAALPFFLRLCNLSYLLCDKKINVKVMGVDMYGSEINTVPRLRKFS